MFSDRIFKIALIFSFLVHSAILFQFPNINLSWLKAKGQSLELNYLKSPPRISGYPKQAMAKQETPLKLALKTPLKPSLPPPFIDKERIFKRSKEIIAQKSALTKPAFTKPDVIAIKKKITLPDIDMDKIDNPSYISYYQILREKIRRAAYQSYTRAEVGEVYLSFIISSDGILQVARLVEERSSSNVYLREIALRSVRDASPFPRFPKELDYPQLSFNVVISFEIE